MRLGLWRLKIHHFLPSLYSSPTQITNGSQSSGSHVLTSLWTATGEAASYFLFCACFIASAIRSFLFLDISSDGRRAAVITYRSLYLFERAADESWAEAFRKVPLEFIGAAPAEKELGGTFITVLHELEIEAMPRDLPHNLTADISGLTDFNTQLHAKDITLPEGVELMTDSDEVIALVEEAKEEVIEEEVTAPDMEAIEVEQKGKGEDQPEAEASKAESESQGEKKEG